MGIRLTNNSRYNTEMIRMATACAEIPSWSSVEVREFKPTPKFITQAEQWASAERHGTRRWPFVKLWYNRASDKKSADGAHWLVHIVAPEHLKEAPLSAMEQIALMGGIAPMDVFTQLVLRMLMIHSNAYQHRRSASAFYDCPSELTSTIEVALKKIKRNKLAVPEEVRFAFTPEMLNAQIMEDELKADWIRINNDFNLARREVVGTVGAIDGLRTRLRDEEARLETRKEKEVLQQKIWDETKSLLESQGYNVSTWRTES
jgi:hypothetical protein